MGKRNITWSYCISCRVSCVPIPEGCFYVFIYPLTHLYTTKKTAVMKHHQTILFLDPKMAHMSSPHSIFTFICRYIYTQQKLYEYIHICIFICLGFLQLYKYHMKTCIYMSLYMSLYTHLNQPNHCICDSCLLHRYKNPKTI